MAFLTLTSETSEPFVIPFLSPISQPNSRKNSDVSSADLDIVDELLSNTNLANLNNIKCNNGDINNNSHSTIIQNFNKNHNGRRNSLTLL